ncbi:MAG: thiamine pyrophosphate-binding protein [Pseudomonadales bacterium]|jgi:acetolactate synthase-1/2/3 large subunit|nr:thiamine pyrophosphate-binding protein [Pseudomonadales bacterium]
MSNFTGADLIANALAQLGIEHVFGIVSIHNMPLMDAINRLGETKIIGVRHEQAGTHAADGYARATGKLGVMIASTGPGTSNTVTGLYEAQYGSSRVLVITGQAETAFYGRGVGYVHEAENQVAMLRSVCRRVESPRHVNQLGPCLQTLVTDLFTGRPAPGALEIPIDLQYAEASKMDFSYPQKNQAQPDSSQLDSAVKRILESKKRIIVAGGGVIAAEASEALQQLARKLDCPVLTTVDGRGVIAEDDPLCVGNYYNSAGIYNAIQTADVTIAIGTRFAVGVDGQFQEQTPPGDLIQIDIDGTMIGRTHTAQFPVLADAGIALTAINIALADVVANDGQFNQSIWEARDGVRSAMRNRLGDDWPKVMDSIRAKLPDDAVFVRDQTISAYNWGNQQFPIYKPRTSINPTSGAIGPGFPMSIGAAIATGRKTVIVHGDGGFMFHATELATAAQYRVPLVICLFNDSGYGVLRWLQSNRFGRINETDLGKVAFAGMARSMGVPGQRVASVVEFEAAFDEAMAATGPYLIDIDMEHFAPMEISVMPKKKNEVDLSR